MPNSRLADGEYGKQKKAALARLLHALQEHQGLMAPAAAAAGITYQTARRYAQQHPEVRAAQEDARERLIDVAEGKLQELIRQGNLGAICFYLKCQAKHRGWVERGEICGVGGGAVQIEVRYKSAAKQEGADAVSGEGSGEVEVDKAKGVANTRPLLANSTARVVASRVTDKTPDGHNRSRRRLYMQAYMQRRRASAVSGQSGQQSGG